MEYLLLKSMLENQEDIDFLNTISSDKMDRPYLLNQILEILADGSKDEKAVNNSNRLKLFRLAKEYFQVCFSAYLDYSMKDINLEELLKYSTKTIYSTFTSNGLRISTESEVENGVEELVPDITRNIDEEIENNLYLMLWTFSGKLRYYKKAGYNYTYVDNKLSETVYTLILRAGKGLRQLIDWVSNKGEYEKAVAVLKLSKKHNKYKYPNYAPDEIKPDISVKQIQYLCSTRIYGSGATDNQREAKRVLFKIKKEFYKPSPYEISIMRKAYNEIKLGITHREGDVIDPVVQDLCNKLIEGADRGLISREHFAFKIIDSIQKFHKCSEKQLAILRDAEEVMDKTVIKETKDKKAKEKEEADTTSSKSELMSMYDALNSGIISI